MLTLAFALMLGVCDLGELFSKPESWETTSSLFATEHADAGFRPTDASGAQVTSFGHGKCAYFGFPLWESRVYFDGPRVARVELSLYNRGDASKAGVAQPNKKELKNLLMKVAEKIDPGGKPPRTERKKNRSGGFQCTKRWPKTDPAAELIWGVSDDDTADFVRLTLKPRVKDKPKGIKKSVSGRAAAAKVKANVTKNAQGDTWIANVPMVDQGEKGYCAAAVAERVLRYYGHDIDEHQIAQMAGSSAERGTSVKEMIETVRTVGSKCRLGFNEIVSIAGSICDIEKEIEKYNKAAKRLKRKELRFNDFLVGNTFMVGRLREAMEPKVVLEMRKKDPLRKRFIDGVRKQTAAGIPVFWGVTLGVFPEPGLSLQGQGGHMRLIIGYNEKTRDILYTDTWGAGHELKRMNEDIAFAITHDAFFLRPL